MDSSTSLGSKPDAVTPSKPDNLSAATPGKPDNLDAVTPSKSDNLWVRAEEMLNNDERTKAIFQAYLEILESEFGSKLKPIGTPDRQKQLCELVDAKTHELEEKKWKVRFGDHDVKVREQLTRAFKNILIAKEIINPAVAASPPAAIACAGVFVVLTVG